MFIFKAKDIHVLGPRTACITVTAWLWVRALGGLACALALWPEACFPPTAHARLAPLPQLALGLLLPGIMLAGHETMARKHFLEQFAPGDYRQPYTSMDQRRWSPLAHGRCSAWVLRLWSFAAWVLLLLPTSWTALHMLAGVVETVGGGV